MHHHPMTTGIRCISNKEGVQKIRRLLEELWREDIYNYIDLVIFIKE